MKKSMVYLLIVAIVFQSTQGYAQYSPQNAKLALATCYEDLFIKAQQFQEEKVELNEETRLGTLKALTMELMFNIKSEEESDWSNIKNVGYLWGSIVLFGGTMIPITRRIAHAREINAYRSAVLEIIEHGPRASVETFNRAKYLKTHIDYWKKSARGIGVYWTVLSAALSIVLIYNYTGREDFSEQYNKMSFKSLLQAKTIKEFEDSLFISRDPSSIELGTRLLNSCLNLVKKEFKPTQVSEETMEAQLNELMDWMNHK